MTKIFNTLEKTVLTFLLLAMTLVTFSQVVARYVFNSGAVWALELTVFLFAWLVLLGAAFLAAQGRHIGIDTLPNALGKRAQRICGLIAVAASIYYAAIMLSGSWTYFHKFYTLKIMSEDLPVPTWVVLAVLPISFAMLLIRFLVTGWQILKGTRTSMLSSIENEELIAELDAARAQAKKESN